MRLSSVHRFLLLTVLFLTDRRSSQNYFDLSISCVSLDLSVKERFLVSLYGFQGACCALSNDSFAIILPDQAFVNPFFKKIRIQFYYVFAFKIFRVLLLFCSIKARLLRRASEYIFPCRSFISIKTIPPRGSDRGRIFRLSACGNTPGRRSSRRYRCRTACPAGRSGRRFCRIPSAACS